MGEQVTFPTQTVTIRKGTLQKNGQCYDAYDEDGYIIVKNALNPERGVVDYYKAAKFRGVILTKWANSEHNSMIWDIRKNYKKGAFDGP